jgi:Brp/Blh family beta-carotene 15,15'-monooxygenase
VIKASLFRFKYEWAVLLFLLLSQVAYRVLESGQWLFQSMFFVMLLLVGLPHGAADILILKSRSRGWAGFLGLCVLYLALSFGMFGLWWILPSLFWFSAFALAIWHFLKIEWSLRKTSLFAPDLALISIVGIPLIHQASFLEISEPLQAQRFARILFGMESWIVGICLGVFVWRVLFFPNRLRHLILVTLFLTVLFSLPLWYGFACFFILLHSARHLELSFERLPDLNSKVYWRILVPMSAACLLPVIVFVKDFNQFIPFAALMLLCLTLPHTIVESALTPTSTPARSLPPPLK